MLIIKITFKKQIVFSSPPPGDLGGYSGGREVA
jgi:hypothetical protein